MSNDIRSSLASIMPTNDADRRTAPVRPTAQTGKSAPQATANTGRVAAGEADEAAQRADARTADKTQSRREEAEEAARALEEKTRDMGRNLRFEVDDDSGTTVIKVVDPSTEEVVRQIPSEEAVARAAALEGDSFNLIDEIA
ncbi:MAG: flagellar protein FlaG [Pseudomonadota bacterium]